MVENMQTDENIAFLEQTYFCNNLNYFFKFFNHMNNKWYFVSLLLMKVRSL